MIDNESATPAVESPERRPFRRPWLMLGLIALISTIVGVLFATRYYFYTLIDPKAQFSFGLALWSVIGWWVWILLTPAVLYLAWKYPFDRTHLRKHLGIHTVGWMMTAVADVTVFSALASWLGPVTGYDVQGFFHEFQRTMITSFVTDMLVYAAIVAIAHAYDFNRRLRDREMHELQLQAQLAEARLQALERQLHPHFLFNTLNAVSALMDEDVLAARHILSLLGELLRLTLDSVDAQEVTVRQEIGFILRYLEIQRIRFRDRLEVFVNVSPNVMEGRIPNLILQPLVENAIKHGRPMDGRSGRIEIHVRREDDRLVASVRDNGSGLPEESSVNKNGTGIGLKNTRQRLQQLYGEAHQLTFNNQPKGGLEVCLSIPFYTSADRIETIA